MRGIKPASIVRKRLITKTKIPNTAISSMIITDMIMPSMIVESTNRYIGANDVTATKKHKNPYNYADP